MCRLSWILYQDTLPSTNNDSFVPLFPILMHFFPCTLPAARIWTTMLNRCDDSFVTLGNPYFPDFEANAYKISQLRTMFAPSVGR